MNFHKAVLILLVCAFGAACSGLDYEEASKLEKQGLYIRAAKYYKRFADKYPGDPRAPESLFRSANIYAEKFGLCSSAVPLFKRLVRNYPESKPWAELGRQRLFNCPDYFPCEPGMKWTYGDSQTGGRNMKQYCVVAGSGAFATGGVKIETSIYAGKKLIKKMERLYFRDNWELREKEIGEKLGEVCILKYPFTKGRAWSSRRGRDTIHYRIADTGITVKTKAGKFHDCLKVRERVEGFPSWMYNYYAPGTGRVLTTVAGKGFENRNTELLSYEKKDK